MSNLAVLSLKNRALIALVTIVAAIFGGLALVNLKQELIPSIEFPQLSIVTTYPGASPEVVSNDVSAPIETAIQGIPGLESTTATSTTNASIIQASFTYGTDLATAEQKITQAINRIKSDLPENVEPNVVSFSFDDLPVIQLAVTGYDDEATIQSQLEASVIPDLEQIDGVSTAGIVGGRGERVTITPDAAALAAAGYTQQAITRRARAERRALPRRHGHRGRPDPHGADRREDRVGRRDRRAAARAVHARRRSEAGAVTIADVVDGRRRSRTRSRRSRA